MAEARVRTVCDMMARAIKLIEQEIEANDRRVKNLRGRLEKLESRPDADPAQIHEIENDIRELEDQLETDLAQLGAFQEEFAASCGG